MNKFKILVIISLSVLASAVYVQVNRFEPPQNEENDLKSSESTRVSIDAQSRVTTDGTDRSTSSESLISEKLKVSTDASSPITEKVEEDEPFPSGNEGTEIASRAKTGFINGLKYKKSTPLNLPEDKAKAMKLTVENITELEEKTLIIPAQSDFADYPSIDSHGSDIERYNGHYEGEIYWKNNNKAGNVTLNISGVLTEQKMVEGYYDFTADAQGHLEIRISSPGYIGKNMRVINESPLTLIMEPQGKKSKNKIQIFFKVESGQTYLTGTIYSADTKNHEKFEDIAIFKMEKI